MNASVVTQGALRAATVRHIGPYPAIGSAFARLEEAAGAAGLMGQAGLLIAIYYDNPRTTPASELRSDAGLMVDPGIELPPGLTDTRLTGGRYLHHRHLGSYEGLPAAWAWLREQGLREHGVTRREGPSYEIYPNNPGNTPIAGLVTDIYIPVS